MIKPKKQQKKKRLAFFSLPRHRTIKNWLWFIFSRGTLAVGGFYLSLTLIFSVVPIPFSAYMAQKKIAHLFDPDYQIKYDWVSIEQIPWQMQMAVIAGEDQQFDNHFGVDVDAIFLALRQNRQSGQKPRGASTISQQTVKNLYLWHGSSWIRKGLELPLTLLIESLWDKRRVLEVYLNIAEFGEGIFGVEAAAQHYFAKPAQQLTLQQAALLAAALPNPFIYKIDSPNSRMRYRQQWIIQQIHNLDGRHYLEKLE